MFNAVCVKFINKLFLLFLFFPLVSCAPSLPQYVWVSSTRSMDLLERDRIECQYWADKEFPANYNTESRITYKNITLNQTTTSGITPRYSWPNRRDFTSNTHNNQSDKHMSIIMPFEEKISVDINKNARNNAFDKCMYQNEWRLVEAGPQTK
ncbi:MAG: hypothetical protein SFT68_04545 [Rickettsiaceae bacterium]|nr:hypothetical protein [Rickettsiaceae bacterium]